MPTTPTGLDGLFELAAASCPASAGPWREMAGLHALAAEWPAAAADAQQALARDSSDALAARILATSLYLTDDTDGALDAWNRVGEPIIDLVNITGLDRTRYSVAARTMALEPRTQLTRGNLTAARRRLSELPSAQAARIAMRPGENGRARVDAAVIERPLVPKISGGTRRHRTARIDRPRSGRHDREPVRQRRNVERIVALVGASPESRTRFRIAGAIRRRVGRQLL